MFSIQKILSKPNHFKPSILKIFHNSLASFTSLKSPCLTRDFINDRLYNPKGGYFCKNDIQIGELASPINFAELLGYEEYTKQLSEKYPKNAWLTPSELFRPWYGITIGNYIHQAFQEAIKKTSNLKTKPRIKIIEVGAGAGSCAEGILFFFQNFEQKHYVDIQYKIVEVSPQMCKRAREKLEKNHKILLDKSQVTFVNENFITYNTHDNELTFVLMCEVADNMPHDRVYYSDEKNEWFYETWVEFEDQDGEKGLKEVKKPISDSIIKEAVNLLNSLPEKDSIEASKEKNVLVEKLVSWVYKTKDEKNIFLPTGCLKMLKNMNKVIPNHHLILADFDLLKNSESAKQGINSPIVSKKLEKSAEKLDFDSYLVKRGEADIFFPTNFRYLKHAYKKICGRKGEVYKTYEFMDIFAKTKWTETRSGYNPLKEDFLNTSIFTTALEEIRY